MEDAGGKEYPLYLVWRTNTLTQGEGTADYSRTQDAAWTPKPKMSSDEWAALVPSVRAAVDEAYGEDVPPRPYARAVAVAQAQAQAHTRTHTHTHTLACTRAHALTTRPP